MATVGAVRRMWKWVPAGAAGVVVSVLVACAAPDGEDFEPPPKPTDREVAALREDHSFPVHWLGPAYEGREIRHVEGDATYALVAYGEDYCDSFDEVCNYEIEVITTPGRGLETAYPKNDETVPVCWHRVGRAVAVGCRPDDQWNVLTGSINVYVSVVDLSPLDVARSLRPMKGGELAAPKPFSCGEMRYRSKRFRRSMPAELRGCRRG